MVEPSKTIAVGRLESLNPSIVVGDVELGKKSGAKFMSML